MLLANIIQRCQHSIFKMFTSNHFATFCYNRKKCLMWYNGKGFVKCVLNFSDFHFFISSKMEICWAKMSYGWHLYINTIAISTQKFTASNTILTMNKNTCHCAIKFYSFSHTLIIRLDLNKITEPIYSQRPCLGTGPGWLICLNNWHT